MLVIVLLLNIDSSIDNFSLFLYASGITLLTSLIVSQLVTKKHGLWLGNLF